MENTEKKQSIKVFSFSALAFFIVSIIMTLVFKENEIGRRECLNLT